MKGERFVWRKKGEPREFVKFTLRVNPEIYEKFRYVSGYNGRSINSELEILMRLHVEKFEKAIGKIALEE